MRTNFPVPEAFVERQIENRVEQRLQSLSQQGVDPRSFNLDWAKIKAAQRDAAMREVKASLILGKVAEREAIGVTNEEVDREVARIAQQNREPVPTVRKRVERRRHDGPHRVAHPDGKDFEFPVR